MFSFSTIGWRKGFSTGISGADKRLFYSVLRSFPLNLVKTACTIAPSKGFSSRISGCGKCAKSSCFRVVLAQKSDSVLFDISKARRNHLRTGNDGFDGFRGFIGNYRHFSGFEGFDISDFSKARRNQSQTGIARFSGFTRFSVF